MHPIITGKARQRRDAIYGVSTKLAPFAPFVKFLIPIPDPLLKSPDSRGIINAVETGGHQLAPRETRQCTPP